MKKFCFAVCCLILFFASSLWAQSLAVLPYKLNDLHLVIPAQTASEYAKLVGVGACVQKDLSVYSPQEIKLELKRLGLDPQKTLTLADLRLLAKGLSVDFIQTGILTSRKNGYAVESLLYSAERQALVSQTKVKGSNFVELANREIHSLYYNLPNKNPFVNQSTSQIDLVLLVDRSYNIFVEDDTVQMALTAMICNLQDLGCDLRLNVLPFADHYQTKDAVLGLGTAGGVAKALEKLPPRGANRGSAFSQMYRYAVKNVPWRPEADKYILVVSNSAQLRENDAQYSALIAKKKGLKTLTLLLARVDQKSAASFKHLSKLTKGHCQRVTYRDKVYLVNGDKRYLYTDGQRLFYTDYLQKQWLAGIDFFAKKAQRQNYTEVFYNENEVKLDPYQLKKSYQQIIASPLLRAEGWQSNLLPLCQKIISVKEAKEPILARVLIKGQKMAFWLPVKTNEELRYYQRQKALGFPFLFGFRVLANPKQIYGYRLVSQKRLLGFSQSYVPDLIKVSLAEISKKPEFFQTAGIGQPSIWFTEVKVERLVLSRSSEDVRTSYR